MAYWELGGWRWGYFPHRYQTRVLWANSVRKKYPSSHGFGEALVDILRGAAGYGFRKPSSGETNWSRMLFDLIEQTAKQTVKRENLRNTRDLQRGYGRLARIILKNAAFANCGVVTRNSLATTLALYSEELGVLGRQIEKAATNWPDDDVSSDEEQKAGRGEAGDNTGGEPPILGDERPSGPEDGAAGNLIFFHFTSE